MRILGNIAFWLAYRISFLVAKWKLGWSYWTKTTIIRWPD